MDVHTCKFYILRAKSTVLAMSRPARVWLFDADQPGLCEFRPFQSIGSGHAMGWRSGIEFTMMEKSVRAEYSAADEAFQLMAPEIITIPGTRQRWSMPEVSKFHM